jgi:hypothetical protein
VCYLALAVVSVVCWGHVHCAHHTPHSSTQAAQPASSRTPH